jgi:hypothetical protein
MTNAAFLDAPPQIDTITPYDEQHLVTYLRLLDAEEEGAKWQEVAKIVFGLDPRTEAKRAQAMHATHLKRAQWMMTQGYRHLLEQKRNV